MEKSVNIKPITDTSKYNLRCNRNISEKMTKKDFIYDIPAPFQAMRKEKSSASGGGPLKKFRNDYERSITSSENMSGSKSKSDSKLNKNSIGLLRLIEAAPQQLKLIPGSMTTTGGGKISNQKLLEIEERIAKESADQVAVDSEGEEIRRQIVLPIQLRRKIGSDSKPPRYSVIPTCNEESKLANSNGLQLPAERKILAHQCNYCDERLATFLSLSTHVKYHCGRHCDTCFWILEPQESMTQHIQKTHPVNASTHVLTCPQ